MPLKRKKRLNVYSLDRTHRQDVLRALSEATSIAEQDHSIAGVIILLTDASGRAQLATGGRLDDPAQAVYYTSLALRWDFLKSNTG